MDGLVLSVTIGFRSYAGDGLGAAEWIAAGALVVMFVSFIVMSLFSFFIAGNFWLHAKARRSIIAKQTTDQVAKLEGFLDSPSFEKMRKKTEEIQKIKEYFEPPLPEAKSEAELKKQIGDNVKYWKGLYDESLSFLGDLESTHHLIKEGAISISVLDSCAGGRILLEYDRFFEPLLRVREILVATRPKKEIDIYYGNTWSGIKKLIEELRELREKDRPTENPPRG